MNLCVLEIAWSNSARKRTVPVYIDPGGDRSEDRSIKFGWWRSILSCKTHRAIRLDTNGTSLCAIPIVNRNVGILQRRITELTVSVSSLETLNVSAQLNKFLAERASS